MALYLAAVALILYACGAGWGWPSGTCPVQVRPWGHDDVMPLGALAELQNTFIHPEPHRYLGYPLMHYFVVALAYVPYILCLLVTGGISHPGPVYPYGLADAPRTLQIFTLIARSISVLMATGIVWMACQIGRVLWGRRTGLLAGLFTLLLYPMVYYSRTGNFDVPYMFWAAVSLWAYALILRGGFTFWRAVALGAGAACAAGTKDQAAAMFFLMPLALLPAHLRQAAHKRALWHRRTWLIPAVAVGSGLLAYVVASGLVFRPERYFAHVTLITRGLTFPSYPATLEGYLGLAGEVAHLLADGMGAPILALAAIGIGVTLVKDRRSLAWLIPAISLLAFFTIPVRFVEMRYLLPVMFVLACYAAYPIGVAMAAPDKWRRWTSVAVSAGACVLPLLRGIELTHFMWSDARYVAAQWLNGRVAPGEKIGFFSVGNHLPRIHADRQYVRVDRFAGTRQNVHYSAVDIRQMGELLLEKNPVFVLVIPDQSAVPGLPYGLTTPPELYRQLEDGSLGYRRAAHLQTRPWFPALHMPDLVDYYQVVNPPVDIFVRNSRTSSLKGPPRPR